MKLIAIEHEYLTNQHPNNAQVDLPEWFIYYTVTGNGLLTVHDKEHHCSRGDLCLLPPLTPHDYRSADRRLWEVIICRFIPQEHWLGKSALSQNEVLLEIATKHHLSLYTIIQNAFLRMVRYSNDRNLTYHQELAHHAFEEITLLLTSIMGHIKPMDDRIMEIIAWIENHIAEPFQVEDLAQRANLSISRLSHLFKEQTGESIVERITRTRLRLAERSLRSSTATITEIAMQCGFNSPEYFTRQFAKHYKMSPARYRKSQRSLQ